jgi:hypothetical protein
LNSAYCLSVYTADRPKAGTDANITFTLTGSKGSSEVTVNAGFRSRMERNDVSFVTLHSPDLGVLKSVTVQRDNAGNAPDWFLDKIVVESFRFHKKETAVFNGVSINPFLLQNHFSRSNSNLGYSINPIFLECSKASTLLLNKQV